MKLEEFDRPFRVPHDARISLAKDYDPAYTADVKTKAEGRKKRQATVKQLAERQDMLYAQNRYAVLVIFQAMDAAGKDSTIKHVMSGLNT